MDPIQNDQTFNICDDGDLQKRGVYQRLMHALEKDRMCSSDTNFVQILL